jgi:hypothetical protein
VTQQADEPNDVGRNFLLGNGKKIAKFLMRTFTCRSTFLYDYNHLIFRKKYTETQEISQEGLNMTIVDRLNSGIIG